MNTITYKKATSCKINCNTNLKHRGRCNCGARKKNAQNCSSTKNRYYQKLQREATLLTQEILPVGEFEGEQRELWQLQDGRYLSIVTYQGSIIRDPAIENPL